MVKVDPHALISFGKSGKDPGIHLFPEGADFRVAGFPFSEHLLCGASQFGFKEKFIFIFVCPFRMCLTHSVDLFGKLGVELHIEVPHQMIPLLAAAFGGDALAETLVSKHGFADVDATVVDQIDLNYLMTDTLEK